MLPARWRSLGGLLTGSFYAVGGIIVTGIAWALPNWRHFQLVCGLAMLFYIPYWW